jgi:L-ascorbate metabolism protein UlaG (beta-lactamase superfamily)
MGHPVARLAEYFTNERAACGAAYDGEGVRVRYFGHACVLMETSRTSILVDPTAAHDRHASVDHFVFSELPPHVDVLFISHGHQDHFVPEFLMRLRERVGLVVIPGGNRGELSDPSLRRMLRQLGYTRIRTLEPLETLEVADGSITGLPFTGEHSDLDVHSKQCALVELKGRRICMLVDTDAVDIDVYRRVVARLVQPDMVFIGMECSGAPLSWLYGPLVSRPIARRNDNSRRLSGANGRRAWDIVALLQPRRVCVYAMGQEPWMRNLMGLNYTQDSVQIKESEEFIRRCRQAGIPADRLYLKMETTL